MQISIFEQSFDPLEWARSCEQQDLEAGKFGATTIFVGTMRDFNEGDYVTSMRLEHYPEMTHKHLTKIAQNALDKWDILDIAIAHRVGEIFPADPIVCVVVWSAHRKQAYEANRMVMEDLKSQAPFWKKEQLAQGERWVEKNTQGF